MGWVSIRGALERGQFPRFGLATMRERAEAVGGGLQVTSLPGKGTTVEAVLPVGIVLAETTGGRDASLDRR
jgi:signal transduction histidine kinase